MSNIKKSELLSLIEEQAEIIVELSGFIKLNKQAIIKLENEREKEPKLKQLDQSVFDGLDEKWRFAAVDADGRVYVFKSRPIVDGDSYYVRAGGWNFVDEGYDTANWQNSLIERDKVELTGSDLCRAMLERGDKVVLCKAYDDEENDFYYDAITSCSDVYFDSCLTSWSYAIPINNQGEPLTQSDVGL